MEAARRLCGFSLARARYHPATHRMVSRRANCPWCDFLRGEAMNKATRDYELEQALTEVENHADVVGLWSGAMCQRCGAMWRYDGEGQYDLIKKGDTY